MFRTLLLLLLLPIVLATGPCCLDDGSCRDLLSSFECKGTSRGQWMHHWGTMCDKTVCLGGHCCLPPDQSYQRLTSVECQERGGVFYTGADGLQYGPCDCDDSCGACYRCDDMDNLMELYAACRRVGRDECDGYARRTRRRLSCHDEEGFRSYVDMVGPVDPYWEFRLGQECEPFGVLCHDGLAVEETMS